MLAVEALVIIIFGCSWLLVNRPNFCGETRALKGLRKDPSETAVANEFCSLQGK